MIWVLKLKQFDREPVMLSFGIIRHFSKDDKLISTHSVLQVEHIKTGIKPIMYQRIKEGEHLMRFCLAALDGLEKALYWDKKQFNIKEVLNELVL
jgi:hypothetical protein